MQCIRTLVGISLLCAMYCCCSGCWRKICFTNRLTMTQKANISVENWILKMGFNVVLGSVRSRTNPSGKNVTHTNFQRNKSNVHHWSTNFSRVHFPFRANAGRIFGRKRNEMEDKFKETITIQIEFEYWNKTLCGFCGFWCNPNNSKWFSFLRNTVEICYRNRNAYLTFWLLKLDFCAYRSS